MSGSWSNQKRKTYHYSSHNKRQRNSLKPGIKGFLCTCNNREKECVREAYNILNEYTDRLAASDKTVSDIPAEVEAKVQDEGSDEDVDTALNKELEQLKAEAKEPKWRRFQVVDSGANNCVFIQSNISDPVVLATSILKDIESTKQQKARFLLRLLPVEVTCRASMEDIKKEVAPLFDKYLKQEPKTFAIVFTRRNNTNIDREEVIRELAEMITSRNPLNKADLKQAEMTVLVEVIRGICCLSVLPDYFKYKKYNLLELCAPEKVDGSGDAKQKEGELCTESDDKEVKAIENIGNGKADENIDNEKVAENSCPDNKDIEKVPYEKSCDNADTANSTEQVKTEKEMNDDGIDDMKQCVAQGSEVVTNDG